MSRTWTLGHVLRRCHQADVATWSATVGPVPTAPQYAVLTVVAAMKDPDMQLVGAVAGLEKTTLTGVARRLERDGWLARRQDPDDRRRHLLTLTASGAVALDQIAPLAAAARAEFLAPVPPETHERLTRHLRELGRVPALPPPGINVAAAAWERLTTTPGHLIRRAQQAHTACWLAEFGQELTGPQYAVLRVVAVQGETTHTRLGELAGLDKATLSGVVDRLVRRRLLSTSTDPSDRRARRLALTDAGREVERSARPRVRRVQTQTAGPVASSDRPWLQDVLEQLCYRATAPAIDLDDFGVEGG